MGSTRADHLAERVENDILDRTLQEGARMASARELADGLGISPGTAVRTFARLIETGTLVKRVGIGMFVADGARERIIRRRRQEWHEIFVLPMIDEARRLGVPAEEMGNVIAEAERGRTTSTGGRACANRHRAGDTGGGTHRDAEGRVSPSAVGTA